QDSDTAVLVAIDVIDTEEPGQILGRLPPQLGAHELTIDIVKLLIAVDVLEETVARFGAGFDAQRALTRQRNVDRTGDTEVLISAHRAVETSRDGIQARLFRDDVDQARRGIASIQRALRTAQHFDPFEIAKLGQRNAGARTSNTVDDDADGGLEAGVGGSRT